MSKRLHAHWVGSGEGIPLVALHGFLGSSRDWDGLADSLGTDRRCLLIDLPGHGESLGCSPSMYTFEGAVQAIRDCVTGENVTRYALLGYSMGGRLALGVAMADPSPLATLILESASGGLPSDEARMVRRGMDARRARELREGDLAGFLGRWYRQPLFATLDDEPGRLDQVVASRRDNDPEELATALEGCSQGRQPDFMSRLGELPLPVCAVAGALDTRYVELAEQMARLCPCGEVAIVPGAGHMAHREDAESFLAVTRAAIKRVENKET